MSAEDEGPWLALVKDTLIPAYENAIEEWMMTPKAKRVARNPVEAQEAAVVTALLKAAGVDTTIEVTELGGNPYLQVYTWCMQQLPAVGQQLFLTEDHPSPEQHKQLAALVLEPSQPVLKWRADLGHFVSASTYEAFHRYVHEPLTNKFAFAVPNVAAVDVLVRHSPLVELGAGTGYWASLARAGGADVKAYDVHECGRPRGDAFGEVHDGGNEVLATLSASTALLLCWPVRPGGLPWDANALAAFAGSVVIHVGEWTDSTQLVCPEHGQTTSVPFQVALERDFACVERVGIPNWPWCRDGLTVWKRK